MVRAPCCEKMGLKKGPWTPEEDQILINYIQQYGHSNWRALPKQAGLLRCGKSCRLRWINYLRPDIKRGNFSREEEDTIIQLHEMLGNRWSAIAARLPGRTDNEIKNVWHTHLKKRLKQNEGTLQTKRHSIINTSKLDNTEIKNNTIEVEAKPVNFSSSSSSSSVESNRRSVSPPQSYSSSEISSSITTSITTATTSNSNVETNMKVDSNSSSDDGNFSEMDESFWSEVLSAENCGVVAEYDPQQQLQCNYLFSPLTTMELSYAFTSSSDDSDMDFWHNVFTCADELP